MTSPKKPLGGFILPATFKIPTEITDKSMSWHIENMEIIFAEDDDWVEELSGKLIANSNIPGSPDYDESMPPYWARGYVPANIDICEVDPAITSGKYSFPGGYSEHDLAAFCPQYVVYPDIQICKSMVASMKDVDPAIELYDRPYTLLPLVDSCISVEMGNTPKTPHRCPYAESGTFEACSAYQPWEDIVIGTVGDDEVHLDRTYKGNKYTYGEHSFESYGALQKYCTAEKLDFVLTYDPVIKDTKEFFSEMMGRLEVVYQ